MTARDRLRVLSALLAACAAVACGGGADHAAGAGPPDVPVPTPDAGTPTPPEEDSGPPPLDCTVEATPGCPCETEGEKVSCGDVVRRSGSYVSCSPGFVTCTPDLVWGDCIGDRIAHEIQ